MENVTIVHLEKLTLIQRRAFLETMWRHAMNCGSITTFLRFFEDFLPQRLVDEGPEQVIREFLGAYERCCEIDKSRAKDILRCFLGYLFDQQETTDINNVFVWLQGLSKNRLLVDAIDLVTSASWLPPNADPKKCKRFELLCRRSQASNWRRTDRRYADARQALMLQMEEWGNFDPTERKEPSIIAYEIGYIDFLAGNVEEAARLFFQSAKDAEMAGDHIGSIINSFCGCDSLRHGGLLEPHEASRRLITHYNDLKKQPAQPRVDAWLLNMTNRLFEHACTQRDVHSAQMFAESAIKGKMMQRGKDEPTYRRVERKIRAQLALVEDKWEEALRHFAAFLDLDLKEWGNPDPDLVRLCDTTEEMAQCYRDAGLALQALGRGNAAKHAWERGLNCPDDSGNRFYKAEIAKIRHLPGKHAADT